MRKIVFSPSALAQFEEGKRTNPKITNRIGLLITSISKTPFIGIGKPEPLKHTLQRKWLQRITHEHRLACEETASEILILSCKFHYD